MSGRPPARRMTAAPGTRSRWGGGSSRRWAGCPATAAPGSCCARRERLSAAICAPAAMSTHSETWRRFAVKLEQSFDVAAPVDRVWQALIDVEHVAPCLPGAAVTSRNDDGTYSGTFTIKIGPTTASYTGKLEMRDVDEGAHTATLHAQGTDKRGQGGANATIVSRVADAGEGTTKVDVETDYH